MSIIPSLSFLLLVLFFTIAPTCLGCDQDRQENMPCYNQHIFKHQGGSCYFGGGPITIKLDPNAGPVHANSLDFGDPFRSHEMHYRFKQKPLPLWKAIMLAAGVLIISLLIGYIFHAAINRFDKVEKDYQEMMVLKARAEAANVAKSQFFAAVSHEIRTPMNGVLGMLQMLMDTNLDADQLDFAQTAHASAKHGIPIINELLDQAKIESGRLELEVVPFDLRTILDNVVSLFSGKSREKEIELAVYVSNQVPEAVVGDPGRFRQIIINLVGNSVKSRWIMLETIWLVHERRTLSLKT